MEDHEKIVDIPDKLKVSNTKSADNESGYEDGVSDANDTLNSSIDMTDITITLSKDTKDKDDHDQVILDSLVDNTSSLTIDTSTRYIYRFLMSHSYILSLETDHRQQYHSLPPCHRFQEEERVKFQSELKHTEQMSNITKRSNLNRWRQPRGGNNII